MVGAGMPDLKLTATALEVVNATLRSLPDALRKPAKDVHVVFEDHADAELVAQGFEPDILGLFVGDPVGTGSGSLQPMPPQIVLYVGSLWDYADRDRDVFREEVRLTYLHELGHFFGWDEDEVAERGLE